MGLNRLVFWVRCGLVVLVVLELAACSSTRLNHAPVEDRSPRVNPVLLAPVKAPAVRQPPGAENAGKPGYYTVKPGDTLIRVALENGQTYQDIARWNHLDNPNRLEVGQVLRVAPPATPPASPTAPAEVFIRPVTRPVATASALAASGAASSAGIASPSSLRVAPVTPEADIVWAWPAGGVILAGFDEVKNKGLDISGTTGDPVLAAAEGRVVYVGAGLRGYGNLIILKHNNVFLTAYAHNHTLLVKEDQAVQKGQQIATMGNSDSDRVKLHFELRRQGKPVDPAKFLPAR